MGFSKKIIGNFVFINLDFKISTVDKNLDDIIFSRTACYLLLL